VSGLDVLLAVAGFGVTATVILAMILITPHGVVEAGRATADVDAAPRPERSDAETGGSRGTTAPVAPGHAGTPAPAASTSSG
jgi:hypothetical protein